jgi:hypothetical protein
MKNWINKNYKTLIIAAFLVPIITVAIVSISHVTIWYGISNPVTWSVYLSIGIEIAALSALAAISANMGSKVYFPFAIVTLVQFIGNIFFAYTYIDINSQQFKDWVDLVSPLVEFLGVEPTDFIGHKRFLAFFAGGMLPVISLSFLHMLVKFTEEDRRKQPEPINEQHEPPIQASDLVGEVSRLRLSEEDLKKIEEVLLNPPPPNEKLKDAAEKYNEKLKSLSPEEILKREEENIKLKRIFEQAEKFKEAREKEFGPGDIENEPTALANSQYREEDKTIFTEEIEHTKEYNESDSPTQEERFKILVDMMQKDEELGLYDEPFVSDDFTIGTDGAFEMTEEIQKELDNVNLSEWDVILMDGLEDETQQNFSTIEPTEDEIQQNFSTITPESENIFQDNQYMPALSDEEIMDMNQDEYERNLQIEDEFVTEPSATPEEVKEFEIPVQEGWDTPELNVENENTEDYIQEITPTPTNSQELVEKKNS